MNLVCEPGGKVFWKDRLTCLAMNSRYIENDVMKRRAHPRRKTDGCFQYQRRIFAHESRGVISDRSSTEADVLRGLLLVFAADTAATTTITRKIRT